MSLTLEHSATQPNTPPALPTPRITFLEYIAQEDDSPSRHHYYYGETIEVAGATLEYNTLCGNLIGELIAALRGTLCCVMPSDMKVKISPKVVYYPDVVVCCDEPSIGLGDVLQNPVLIAEVTSDLTEAFDRGKKFQEYRAIASLRHLLYIDQYRPFVEHWERDNAGVWKLAGQYDALNQTLTLTLGDRDVTAPLSDLYRFITFARDAEPDDA